jgi:hypothetical protein
MTPSRLLNRAPMLPLRSPLHGLMSGRTLLLTYTGRRSGRRLTLPANYLWNGGALLLLRDLIAVQPSYRRSAHVELRSDGTPDPTSLQRAAQERALVRIEVGWRWAPISSTSFTCSSPGC